MTQPNTTQNLAQVGRQTGVVTRPAPESLADVLERVLDKGVVVVGDVGVSILDIELLTLKIRLLIASADTAREMGIDWWLSDPFFSSHAVQSEGSEMHELQERVRMLENDLEGRSADSSGSARKPRTKKAP
jgi:hypothetical protein